MDIIIKVIDRKEMRPGMTVADWYFDENGDCQVRVEHLSDWRREVALAFHEAGEAVMCKHSGVTVEEVDKFDRPFEEAHDGVTNVGDKQGAPYRRQHNAATAMERILTGFFDICWEDYDMEVGEYGKYFKWSRPSE
jgi:hypothetical protein